MRSIIARTAFAALLVCGQTALAQDAKKPQNSANAVSSDGKFYLGAGAGLVIPEDTNFKSNTSSGGAAFSTSGKLQFQDGYSLSAMAGYKFNDYLRAEAEVDYTRFEYDSISMNGTITSGGTTYNVNGSTSLDGTVTSVLGLVNGVVTPLGKSRVSPLVGGGVGFASTEEKITAIGGQSANISGSHTDLALSGMLGVEAMVTNNASIDLRYRYMWVDSGNETFDDFTAHNISANAAIHF